MKQIIIVSNHKFYNQFKEYVKDRTENIKLVDDGSTSNENRLRAIDIIMNIEICFESLGSVIESLVYIVEIKAFKMKGHRIDLGKQLKHGDY